jgi:adenine-specific DNA-methyltransferase
LASDPATTLIKGDESHNQKNENKNSENLLIKGDNLEVLKHLANAYYEQLKMIYIDPPYNTGGDGFLYQDDRKYTVKELQEQIGIDEERAKRILEFTQSKNNSHSAWLTFMYPRLYIAYQLLKDEGIIFISIDDNEYTQLKFLIDEIFGEENFVGNIPTIMNLKGNQDNFGFAETHEYFLVYAKNKSKAIINKFDVDEEELLSIWQEDEYGLYKEADNLRATGENAPRSKRPNLWYPIFLNEETNEFYITEDDLPVSESDTFIWPINPEGEELSWYWGKTTFQEKQHNLILKKTTNGWQFYRKQRPELGDLPTKKPKSIFYKSDYSTSTATTQLKNLFGKKVFKGPKPKPFIMDLLVLGMDSSDTVLDFFAGSGTTGDAVLQLNANDGGNRKFILVQLPEQIDSKKNKVAYDFVKEDLGSEIPTIFDITKERINRASKKILKETIKTKISEKEKEIKVLEGKLDLEDKEEKIKLLKGEIRTFKEQDLGFKIYETTPIWEHYDFEAEQFDSSQTLFDVGKLMENDIKALLTTWKTYDGIPLTQDLEKVDLNDYRAYYGNGKLYLMNKGFTTDHLKFLLEKIDSDKKFNPTSIITFGYHFESKNLRELSENVKSYSNKKNIDIDFVTRY